MFFLKPMVPWDSVIFFGGICDSLWGPCHYLNTTNSWASFNSAADCLAYWAHDSNIRYEVNGLIFLGESPEKKRNEQEAKLSV